MKPIVYYSQNREDLILAALFSDTKRGFYVDVGAHHPTEDSVTKYFYDKGWKGINIEPQQKQFDLLKDERPNDINLQIGIADKPGHLILRSYESSGLSTFAESLKKAYSEKDSSGPGGHKDLKTRIETLGNVFNEQHVKKIHFLKIDVEGMEYEVLAGNDWKKYRPEVICIESNHILKDWHDLIKGHGYVFAFFDGLNEYFVAKEAESRTALFRKKFPELLVARPLLPYGWKVQIDNLEQSIMRLQKALDDQIAYTNSLDAQLKGILTRQQSTKYLIKQIIKNVLRKNKL